MSDVSSANGLTDSDSAPETEPWVQVSDANGLTDSDSIRTARVTATVDERKHRFELSVEDHDDGQTVALDHQETLTRRGSVETSTPSDDVYDLVSSHDDVQAFVANSDR